jgi:hypothetical protein
MKVISHLLHQETVQNHLVLLNPTQKIKATKSVGTTCSHSFAEVFISVTERNSGFFFFFLVVAFKLFSGQNNLQIIDLGTKKLEKQDPENLPPQVFIPVERIL